MSEEWRTTQVMVVVKAYPNPSTKYVETCCVAGIEIDTQQWIRLYPIHFRMLDDDVKFRKYDIIECRVRKADNDSRRESYNIDSGSIRYVRSIDTGPNRVDMDTKRKKATWGDRNALVLPLRANDLEELRGNWRTEASLGIIKVRNLKKLKLEPNDGYDPGQASTGQQTLERREIPPLETLPVKFSYQFDCANPACRGHECVCVDWEIYQAYRKWRRLYPDTAVFEEKFRQTFEAKMRASDLYFYMGSMHARPQNFIIIGLYWPPVFSAPDPLPAMAEWRLQQIAGRDTTPVASGGTAQDLVQSTLGMPEPDDPGSCS